MNTTSAFEKSVREAKFASLDEARKWIRSNPLVGDYVLDSLIAGRVLQIMPDGSVTPREFVSKAGGQRTPGAWGETWPKRDMVMQAIFTKSVVDLGYIRQWLASKDEPSGQWACLHSLWHLMKEGVVIKERKKYYLSDDAAARMEADEMAQKAGSKGKQGAIIPLTHRIKLPNSRNFSASRSC
jgi:hypothetical protein